MQYAIGIALLVVGYIVGSQLTTAGIKRVTP